MLVWDGNCGFCKYWVIRWSMLSRGKVDFVPYQKAAELLPDIDVANFKEAARLVDIDGKFYDGPAAAYKSLQLAGKYPFLMRWYVRFNMFRWLSDIGYQWIADHRDFCMRATKFLFGDNPIYLKPYWLFYLMMIFGILTLLF